MSRTLLSNRLKELVNIGLITRQEKQATGQVDYVLTESGKALESVVFSMASWGQEWLETEPSLDNIDGSFLMWDIRRNVRIHEDLPNLFIAHFFLTDMPENKSEYWLIFENGQVDLCYVDRGFNVDVNIEVAARELTKIWMGWEDFSAAVKDQTLKFRGPKKYTEIAEYWLGCSTLAHIKKREGHLLVSE
ncbi:HxlR family transcriptional regulator [Paraglaciecola mesophila KMM 241]|uniref:HxlR family transcriptional regulator n=2 Tax=Paraglaciecola mesophila TaxID=197222 RepID=K6ZQQ6_9ALTE|nr:HxlR family transcriptional regulator [Paraglaciecola mesophila KMM 241]